MVSYGPVKARAQSIGGQIVRLFESPIPSSKGSSQDELAKGLHEEHSPEDSKKINKLQNFSKGWRSIPEELTSNSGTIANLNTQKSPIKYIDVSFLLKWSCQPTENTLLPDWRNCLSLGSSRSLHNPVTCHLQAASPHGTLLRKMSGGRHRQTFPTSEPLLATKMELVERTKYKASGYRQPNPLQWVQLQWQPDSSWWQWATSKWQEILRLDRE